ncbi:HigA family addiction module antitoxin [Duganella vulcania]|nr:HigA family addiction module antitoxin [Duganella vulcania]
MSAYLQEIHPGEILREEFMKPVGLSEAELVAVLDVPSADIIALIAETGPVTQNLARALAAHFKVSVQFWLNLQAAYDAGMKENGGRQ